MSWFRKLLNLVGNELWKHSRIRACTKEGAPFLFLGMCLPEDLSDRWAQPDVLDVLRLFCLFVLFCYFGRQSISLDQDGIELRIHHPLPLHSTGIKGVSHHHHPAVVAVIIIIIINNNVCYDLNVK